MAILDDLYLLKLKEQNCISAQKKYNDTVNNNKYRFSIRYLEDKVRSEVIKSGYTDREYKAYVWYSKKVIDVDEINKTLYSDNWPQSMFNMDFCFSLILCLGIIVIPLLINYTFWRLLLFVIVGAIVGCISFFTHCYGFVKLIFYFNYKNKVVKFHQVREKIYRKYYDEHIKHQQNDLKYAKENEQYLYDLWNKAYNEFKNYNFLGNEVKYLDAIINKISTKRADTVKEALQLIDADIANNRLQRIVQSELQKQTHALQNLKINNTYNTYNSYFNYEETLNINQSIKNEENNYYFKK